MKIKREIKVGIYVVGIIFVMYWTFNFLKGQDIFNKSDSYYAHYDNVEGLVPTAQVFIKGLKVGLVEKINYNQDEKRFEVRLRIESGYIIPDNSIAKIYSSDIMGNKAVTIVLGNSPKQLAQGSVMNSSISTDLMTEIMPLKGKLDSILMKIDQTFTAINNVLTDEKQDEVKNIITNIDNSMLRLASISATIDKEKTQIVKILENAEAFTATLAASTDAISGTLANLMEFSDTLRRADISAIATKFNNLLTSINNTDGTIGQLIHNGDLHQNLVETLRDLDLLLKDLKENPKKYVKLSLF